MSVKNKSHQGKKTVARGVVKIRRIGALRFFRPIRRAVSWQRSLLPKTPHKSFRRTYRRDYERSLELPGYIAFTAFVWRTLWQYRTTMGALVAIYSIASGLIVGLVSQTMYSQLSELMRATGGEVFSGNVGKLGEAGTLLLAGLSGGINPEVGEAQQVLSALLVLLAWLTTVWLLRAFMAGQKPSLRDGLYNSGAPLVPTLLLGVLLLAQLIPAALATIGISAAMPTGLVDQGVEAMLFWVVVLMLMVLSLYWVTSTLIALVVVTLPGMYPLKALKAAHELVVGRRLRVVLRVIWLTVTTVLAWGVTLIPIILFDTWLKGALPAVQWLPIVPIALLMASAASVVWSASYIYLLYRKVVDDGTTPA